MITDIIIILILLLIMAQLSLILDRLQPKLKKKSEKVEPSPKKGSVFNPSKDLDTVMKGDVVDHFD